MFGLSDMFRAFEPSPSITQMSQFPAAAEAYATLLASGFHDGVASIDELFVSLTMPEPSGFIEYNSKDSLSLSTSDA